MADLGSAFVQVLPDTSALNAQMGAYFTSSRWKGMGKAAGVALGAGLAAGGVVKGLYEIGQAFDDAYDKIRVSTGKSGRDLGKLKRSFKDVVSDVPTDFDTASTAVADLSRRLDLSGKPLERLSKQMLELSRITETDVGQNIQSVTRLFGDWSIKTGKQSQTLDKLFRVSQATGIQVGDLSDLMVQFGSPLRQLGIDFDTAAAMFSRFEREGVNIQTLMPGLRFALKTLSGATPEVTAELEKLGIATGDPAKGLQQVFEQIEDAGSAAKANQLAFKVFGVRAGPDMAAAIREGRFELDELMQVMGKGSDTIRDAARDTMDFGEQWTLLKNNVFVALEPVAKRVFGAIGDEAARLRKILTDKDLSADEKFSAVLGEIGRVVKEYGPEIAEAGGKLGITLIKGIANAFWDSDLLGKLFIGAGALRLLGGPGVFGRLGVAMGRRVSSSMAGAIGSRATASTVSQGVMGIPYQTSTKKATKTAGTRLGKGMALGIGLGMILSAPAIADMVKQTIDEVKKLVEGHKLGAPDREKFAVNLEEMFEVEPGSGRFLGKFKVAIDTEMGRLIFDSRTEKLLKAQSKKLKRFIGDDMGEVWQGYQKILRRPTKVKTFDELLRGLGDVRKGSRTTEEAWKDWIDQLGKGAGRGNREGKRHATVLGAALDKIGGGARDTGNVWKGWIDKLDRGAAKGNRDGKRHAGALGDALDKIVRAADRTADRVGDYAKDTDKSFDKTTSSSGKMAKGVGRNVEALVNGVGEGLGVLKDNLNKSLAAFKVKSVSYSIKKAGNVVGDVVGAQHGAIVPGTGSGDKVPALLEPGEVVLNRKAVAAMGGAERANSINRKIPRFAKGGKVSGSMAAMIGLVNKYEQASYPYLWGGGHGGFPNGSSPVDCSGFVSDVLHAGGLLSGAPMVSGALMSWGKPASGNEPLVVYANPGHTVMSLNGRVAGTSGSNPGGGAGWIEGGNGASLAPGAKRTMDVAGAAAAIAEKIARIILKGPDGPLKDMGQAALDKARNAANKYIASKMPSGTPGGGNVGDTIAKTMTGTATWYGPLTSQLGAPVSGSGGLLSGNENAFAELGRGTSVGTALGSLPMGTWIKATILGHTANLEKRDVGQGGASTDLVDVWEDSLVNFPGLREAGRAKIKVEPTHKQTGGIIQRLAKGGIVELLGATIGAIRHMNDKRTTKAVERWGEAVKGYGVPAKLVERMVALRHDADKFGEYASNAATLSDDDGIFGRFLGATEAEWTQKQLSALFKLRNRLIAAKKLLDRQIRQQVKVLKEAESRLRQTNRAIGEGEDEREDLEERLEKAKKAKNKDLEEHLQARLDSLDERQEVREAIAAKLKSPIISSLKKLGGRLKGGSKEFSSRSLVEEALTSVQGIDGPMRKLTKLPAIGALGGEIFEAQVTLRNLDAEAHPTDTGLDIAGLRDVIEAARYGVFDRYAGTFGSGGRLGPGQWGIAGETGRPEIVHGPATVLSPQATQGALAGNIEVHNDFDFDGMDLIVTTTVNGELAKQQRLEHRRSRQAVR